MVCPHFVANCHNVGLYCSVEEIAIPQEEVIIKIIEGDSVFYLIDSNN